MRLARMMVILAGLAAIAGGGFAYTKVMARLAPGTPPPMAEPAAQADLIRVSKSGRWLQLLRGTHLLAEFEIALGGDPMGGHKQAEGDQRTPEGRYFIDWRNPRSVAHLSLHISYPQHDDRAAAAAAGHAPGGNIMIHGLPNGWGWLGAAHLWWDWTDGCIAVTNGQMQQIWALVPDGTAIEILP